GSRQAGCSRWAAGSSRARALPAWSRRRPRRRRPPRCVVTTIRSGAAEGIATPIPAPDAAGWARSNAASCVRARPLLEVRVPAMDVGEGRIELDPGERGELERREQRAIADGRRVTGDELPCRQTGVEHLERRIQPVLAPLRPLRRLLPPPPPDR